MPVHADRVVDSPGFALAKRIASELRCREGPNLAEVGEYGSVARGTERRCSDVDLLVVLKRKRPARKQFLRAARRALLETCEDLGKLRNPVISAGFEEAPEMAISFTGGAMGVLIDMQGYILPTGRRAIVELRRPGRLGQQIRSLSYEPHPRSETSRSAEDAWAAPLRRARQRGVAVDDFA